MHHRRLGTGHLTQLPLLGRSAVGTSRILPGRHRERIAGAAGDPRGGRQSALDHLCEAGVVPDRTARTSLGPVTARPPAADIRSMAKHGLSPQDRLARRAAALTGRSRGCCAVRRSSARYSGVVPTVPTRYVGKLPLHVVDQLHTESGPLDSAMMGSLPVSGSLKISSFKGLRVWFSSQ